MNRYICTFAVVLALVALVYTAPAEEKASPPAGGPEGFLETLRNVGGQAQKAFEGIPEGAKDAASQFQNWASGAGSTISKTAQDAFQGFTGFFQPRRNSKPKEDDE